MFTINIKTTLEGISLQILEVDNGVRVAPHREIQFDVFVKLETALDAAIEDTYTVTGTAYTAGGPKAVKFEVRDDEIIVISQVGDGESAWSMALPSVFSCDTIWSTIVDATIDAVAVTMWDSLVWRAHYAGEHELEDMFVQLRRKANWKHTVDVGQPIRLT